MKVIITGATGFLGRNLAESLHDDGVDVVATGRTRSVGDELSGQGMAFLPADILDAEGLEGVFASGDCVVHCAGRYGDWGSYDDFHRDNVVGTRNVVRACDRHGIRKLIFISTPSMYYDGKDRLDIAESEPLPEQTMCYGKTKRIAELELLALRERGYRVIILRPRAVYGPHDNTIVPRILRMAKKRRMPMVNHGRALVDITYVGNFVDVVRASLNAGDEAWNEVYNVSNGDPMRVRDWFQQVLDIFDRPFRPLNVPEPAARAVAMGMEWASRLPFGPKEPSLTRFSVGYMAKSMTMSIAKAKEKLGWSPRVGNREGFERYADWVAKRH